MACRQQTVHAGAGGGLWNCARVPEYSKETQELLKVMMQEAKLTHLQQRQIIRQVKSSGTLPSPSKPNSSNRPIKPKPQIPLPGKQLKRSAEICRSGDNYEREKFRPSATIDRDKEKRRLQHILATGKELVECPKPQNPEPESQEKQKDRFQEVLDEIEDRKQFLEDMKALGKDRQYRNIINTEISQKLRELEMIDKSLNKQLKILEEEKEKAERTKD